MTTPTTSQFTDEPIEPLVWPRPEVTSTEVPEGVLGNARGPIILQKKCHKMGYDTRLTYARGYVHTKGDFHLRHSLLLWIIDDGQTVAGAYWEAPAEPGDDPWSVSYKTRSCIHRDLPGTLGSRQLEEYLLDPTTDPRTIQEVTP